MSTFEEQMDQILRSTDMDTVLIECDLENIFATRLDNNIHDHFINQMDNMNDMTHEVFELILPLSDQIMSELVSVMDDGIWA
jgi:hypothetical protein